MKNAVSSAIVLIFALQSGLRAQPVSVLHLSHDSTVRVVSRQGNSSGTGFLVGDRLILTCLHVVARTERDSNGVVNGVVFNDLQVMMPSGEIIDADVVSKPIASRSS
jgi:hypothetical protein